MQWFQCFIAQSRLYVSQTYYILFTVCMRDFPLYRRKQLSRNQNSSELYEILHCMSSSGNTKFAISHLLRIAIPGRWTVMISKGHGTEYASALFRTLWVFGLEFNFTFWLFSLHCGNFSAVSGCVWVFHWLQCSLASPSAMNHFSVYL